MATQRLIRGGVWILAGALGLLAGCDDDEASGGAAVDAAVIADSAVASPDAGAADMGIGEMVDAEIPDAAVADAEVVDASTPDAGAPSLQAETNYERDVAFGWIAAGQPTEDRVRAVVAAGVPIISLRYPEEDPFDEAGLVAELGGSFTRYPTSGADYDRVAFREGMYDLYEAAIEAGGTVYLHCASGNRVGASWALFHAERLGVPPEEALEIGRQAGLSGLESRVREILGL